MLLEGKHFAKRLHKSLDNLSVPNSPRERVSIFSKMLHIPRHQAWSLLEGYLLPDTSLLQQIASELDVEPHWLVGEKKA